jgi:DNA repair protein RadA/Sms
MYRADYVEQNQSKQDTAGTLEEAEELEGERVNTGIPGLNRVLGTNRIDDRSGLHLPSSIIFSGGQGSGKSTLLLEMLALIKEKKTLLISTEQTLGEIKLSLIGIGRGKQAAKIHAYSLLDDHCEVDIAFKKIEEENPRVVVIDSLTKMRSTPFSKRDKALSPVEIVERFKRDAETNSRAVILVAHMTKGDQISGKREQLYDVSTVLMLIRQDAHTRLLHCPDKNRFGSTAETALFRIDRQGIREIREKTEEQREMPKRRRKEKAKVISG